MLPSVIRVNARSFLQHKRVKKYLASLSTLQDTLVSDKEALCQRKGEAAEAVEAAEAIVEDGAKSLGDKKGSLSV